MSETVLKLGLRHLTWCLSFFLRVLAFFIPPLLQSTAHPDERRSKPEEGGEGREGEVVRQVSEWAGRTSPLHSAVGIHTHPTQSNPHRISHRPSHPSRPLHAVTSSDPIIRLLVTLAWLGLTSQQDADIDNDNDNERGVTQREKPTPATPPPDHTTPSPHLSHGAFWIPRI
jgi:hypothetical protein